MSEQTLTTAPASRRKVGRHHLAFFRGYLLGLDLGKMAHQYLETGLDLRIAKRTVQWIALELSMAARRQGQHAYARLVRIGPARLSTATDSPTTPPLPTLEAFRESRDPDGDFYTERELIELYKEEYGGHIDRKAQRNARLRDRQLQALDTLYELLATDPHPDDRLAAWLDETVATRLAKASLHTLRDLIQRINERGYRWWTQVPRLGEKGALRLVDWLRANQATLALPLRPQALAPQKETRLVPLATLREATTTLAPLEAFRVPDALDGSAGSNRADPARCKLKARNDYEAIQVWLNAVATNPHTLRAYRKEVERWLLWAILERGQPIASLTTEECIEYRAFLHDLGRTPEEQWQRTLPQEQWIGHHSRKRWSSAWRPFDGPLSESSQRSAQIILTSCCEWLTRQRYLDSNPWDGVPPRAKTTVKIGKGRSLTQTQWRHLLDHCETLPRDMTYHRLRFSLRLAYMTGLRVSELVQATLGDLEPITGPEIEDGWMLNVIGKGNRLRQVPMPSILMKALKRYLQVRNIEGEGASELPLIASLEDSRRGVTASLLYKNFKALFQEAAATLALTDPSGSKRLAAASTHWLRHSYGTHALEKGVPLEVVQGNLGHASLDTTTHYVTAEEQRRYREIERISQAEGQ